MSGSFCFLLHPTIIISIYSQLLPSLTPQFTNEWMSNFSITTIKRFDDDSQTRLQKKRERLQLNNSSWLWNWRQSTKNVLNRIFNCNHASFQKIISDCFRCLTQDHIASLLTRQFIIAKQTLILLSINYRIKFSNFWSDRDFQLFLIFSDNLQFAGQFVICRTICTLLMSNQHAESYRKDNRCKIRENVEIISRLTPTYSKQQLFQEHKN